MDFKIRYTKNNALKLSGELTKINLRLFELIAYQALSNHKDLTIDISNVTIIDRVGIESILELYKHSLKKKKAILFYGYGARDIMEEIRYKNIA
ncbi:STAS domain-containing protein [Tenacibaculum sp. 190130A14a]